MRLLKSQGEMENGDCPYLPAWKENMTSGRKKALRRMSAALWALGARAQQLISNFTSGDVSCGHCSRSESMTGSAVGFSAVFDPVNKNDLPRVINAIKNAPIADLNSPAFFGASELQSARRARLDFQGRDLAANAIKYGPVKIIHVGPRGGEDPDFKHAASAGSLPCELRFFLEILSDASRGYPRRPLPDPIFRTRPFPQKTWGLLDGFGRIFALGTRAADLGLTAEFELGA